MNLTTAKLLISILILVILYILVFGDDGEDRMMESNTQVFHDLPLNFGGNVGTDSSVIRLENGRIALKKIVLPKYDVGAAATIEIRLKSAGDRWDKSGSCFLITDTTKLTMLNLQKEGFKYPKGSEVAEGYGGVKATNDFHPALELMRFMTPFGVGHYSEAKEDDHRKPVYIPKWEDEVVWQADITEMYGLLTQEVYVGIWIDTWTKEGYEVSVDIHLEERQMPKNKILPLVNTISYTSGQKLPDFFSSQSLNVEFTLDESVKNASIHYITTGHGGHAGGDEFIPTTNQLYLDEVLKMDTIPWRDDCASFRRYNPTSGVWLIGDTATYIDWESHAYKKKYIEERQASSDLSRSNWCPGSVVAPFEIPVGELAAGNHSLSISIPGQQATEEELNHWLVSAYLIFENQ